MVGTRFYGRMGNVLFQAAHCIAYGLKHGLDFSMPNRTTNPYWNPIYLSHLVSPNWVQGKEDILINEKCHEYQEIEFKEEWRNLQIVLNGYWQTALYFDKYRNEILYLFDFPYELKNDVCSIHARYGDYLTIPGKHILINGDYLNKAMSIIKEKTGITKFKVFSDDIKLFKTKFGDIHNFEYSTNTNEVDDLIEMSCCHSNINSSSTFSWWGSYLNRNENKIIITPEKWFQDGWDGLITKDIIPITWLKI